jgi:hypothetical protein
MTSATQTMVGGTKYIFGLGKNFSRDEGVWYVKLIIGSKYRIGLLKQCKQNNTLWPMLCDASQQLG